MITAIFSMACSLAKGKVSALHLPHK